MTHALKTWPEFYQKVVSGEKTFEFRKNDRPFKVGDTLLLQEFDPLKSEYTGNEHSVIITYILINAPGSENIIKGFIIMSIKEKEF